jgi:hypothetical protein
MFVIFNTTSAVHQQRNFESWNNPSALPIGKFDLSQVAVGPKGIYYLPGVEAGLARFANKDRKLMSDGDAVVVKALKACSKASRQFVDVLTFLNKGRHCVINPTGSALIECFELGMLNIDPYTELRFRGVAGHNFTTHHVSLRTHNFSPSMYSWKDFNYTVNIITGVCLFNEALLTRHQAQPADWDLLRRRTGTLYEVETLLRLSTTITEIIKHLPNDVAVILTLDVPHLQYVLGNPLFQSPTYSRPLYDAWSYLIAARRLQLIRAFKAILWAQLGNSRLNLDIRCSDGLHSLQRAIELYAGNPMDLSAEAMSDHLTTADETWRAFINRIKCPPKTQAGLISLGYAYELLRPLLSSLSSEQEIDNSDKTEAITGCSLGSSISASAHAIPTPPVTPSPLPTDFDPLLGFFEAGKLPNAAQDGSRNAYYPTTTTSLSPPQSPEPTSPPPPPATATATTKAASVSHLSLVIDNPGERRTFIVAKDFLKQNDKELSGKRARTGAGTGQTLIGIYPMERVFVRDSQRRSSLYSFDGPELEVHQAGANKAQSQTWTSAETVGERDDDAVWAALYAAYPRESVDLVKQVLVREGLA